MFIFLLVYIIISGGNMLLNIFIIFIINKVENRKSPLKNKLL